MKRNARIIVADDHTLFRAGLIRMLASLSGVKVVAQAGNAHEVVTQVLATPADVLMLDLSMPGAVGVSLIEQVCDVRPTLPILVLSMHDEPALVRTALSAGASGYITKNVTPDILAAAIGAVAAGMRYVASGLGESPAADPQGDPGARVLQLTSRELEILRLIAALGLSLVEVAERLGVSPKTITTHKSNIMSKLGVTSNLELIRYVVDHRPFG